MSERSKKIYFSKQCCLSLYCGLHALNNLYGRQQFTITELNNICYSLSDDFINPHKYIFGGEYDANVLIKALQSKQNQVRWHDNRKQFKLSQYQGNIKGILVNINLGERILSRIFRTSARHWLAVKKIQNMFAILDSSSSRNPIWLNDNELNSYVNDKLKQRAQIMIVRQQ